MVISKPKITAARHKFACTDKSLLKGLSIKQTHNSNYNHTKTSLKEPILENDNKMKFTSISASLLAMMAATAASTVAALDAAIKVDFGIDGTDAEGGKDCWFELDYLPLYADGNVDMKQDEDSCVEGVMEYNLEAIRNDLGDGDGFWLYSKKAFKVEEIFAAADAKSSCFLYNSDLDEDLVEKYGQDDPTPVTPSDVSVLDSDFDECTDIVDDNGKTVEGAKESFLVPANCWIKIVYHEYINAFVVTPYCELGEKPVFLTAQPQTNSR